MSSESWSTSLPLHARSMSFDDPPALVLATAGGARRSRTRSPDLELVLLVVRLVLRRGWSRTSRTCGRAHAAHDHDHDRLLHLVASHDADRCARALAAVSRFASSGGRLASSRAHRSPSLRLGRLLRRASLASAAAPSAGPASRADARRGWSSRARGRGACCGSASVSSSWLVNFLRRCWNSSSSQLARRAAAQLVADRARAGPSASSVFHLADPPAASEPRLDRELVVRQAERLARQLLVDALDLVHHAARARRRRPTPRRRPCRYPCGSRPASW